MKIPIYIKIAKTKKRYKVEASEKADTTPIITRHGKNNYHPTIFFGVEIQLPEDAFEQAKKIIAKIDYRAEEIVNVDEETQTEIKTKINKISLDKLRK